MKGEKGLGEGKMKRAMYKSKKQQKKPKKKTKKKNNQTRSI